MQHFNLNQLAEFKDSGPAVQMLAQSIHFRQLLFGFRAGQELKEHTAPSQISVQVISGQLTFEVADKSYALEAGQMLLLEAAVPHGVRAQTDAVMLLVMMPDPHGRAAGADLGVIESSV